MKLGDAQAILQQMERDYNLNKTVKDSMMDLPDKDSIQLFGKFATPDHFQPDSNDSVTRENSTANLSETDFQIVTTVSSIRSNFIRLFKTDYKDDQHIKEIIDMIGDDITVRLATSKGRGGWLGNLIISSKKLAEIATRSLGEAGRSIFNRGK